MNAPTRRRYRQCVGIFAFLVLLILPSASRATGPEITDKLMDCCSKKRTGATVDTVVLHFSSDIAANPLSPYDVDKVVSIFKAANVSAHYIIDREGKIYRLVKEEEQAFHAGEGKLPRDPARTKINDTSIGVELLAIGTEDEMKPLLGAKTKEVYAQAKQTSANIGYTEKQYKSLKALLTDITKRRNDIKMDRKHIIGHDEYAPERRTDPGSLFDWTRIGLSEER